MTNLSCRVIIQALQTSWTLVQLGLAFVGTGAIALLPVSHVEFNGVGELKWGVGVKENLVVLPKSF